MTSTALLSPVSTPADDLSRARLRAWFGANRRPLPIRTARTPWAVLVAEVMSQQTQVGRIGTAWTSFVERWPAPADLADASTGDLLDAWAGLGYNRRALLLRIAARTIVERHGGSVPGSVVELEALPGIGPYTARAVAAHAFSVPVAPLDVNIRRALGRLAGPGMVPRLTQRTGDSLVWRDDPGAWVDAMMDLAALVCTPRTPACGSCPIAQGCRSRGREVPARTPRPTRAFRETARWLRGELLRGLRGRPRDEWVSIAGAVGSHSPEDVARALRQLEAEGFLELSGATVRIAR